VYAYDVTGHKLLYVGEVIFAVWAQYCDFLPTLRHECFERPACRDLLEIINQRVHHDNDTDNNRLKPLSFEQTQYGGKDDNNDKIAGKRLDKPLPERGCLGAELITTV